MKKWLDYLRGLLLPADTEWTPVGLPPKMGRRVNGVWQYRAMTADEELDYMSREAW